MALSFLGDLYLDKEYRINFKINDYILNLEYPISENGIPAKNKINLIQSRSFIYETFNTFPLAVNLANNHIMDYGEEAFYNTIQFLENNDIKYFGAGNKSNNFNNPCILKYENKNIGLFGFSCPSTHAIFGGNLSNGSASLIEKEVIRHINEYRNKVDFLVIILHWGDEEIPFPKHSDVRIARNCIDTGADLIIGHHAHVIQSYEVYKNKYIFYGLGNFIFPDLEINSYFNGNQFTSRFFKKHNISNRTSLIVVLDENFKITFYKSFMSNDSVSMLNDLKLPTWIPKTESAFNIYRYILKRKNMIIRFFKNPKNLRLAHILRFLGIKK